MALPRRARRDPFALFPLVYVVSAAFNAVDSLSGASLIPDEVTLDNFRQILSGIPGEAGSSEAALDVPYVNWYAEHARHLGR